jgi:hypothetical protein
VSGNELAPDAVVQLPGSAAAVVAWRWRGRLHVTVIVKASFAFAPDAPMPRIEPQQVLPAEINHGKSPTRSVRFPSELAPHLGRADVLFTGSAHAAGGAPVQSMPVRVAVYTEQRSLLDKQLLAQDPAGFQRMPIVYERASRGVDGLENPFGVDASSAQPSIVDPAQPERTAGFGPIARAWPTRKRLLGATPRKALEGAIAEIPEGFDWSYYQAAPLDQRTDFLAGDEWILLEGLHPTLPRLQTRLPSARASARVFGLSVHGTPEGQRLDLTADMLHIDGDEQRCSVVFRKSFPVPAESALPTLRIAAGVEIGNEALPWPDPRAARPSRAAFASVSNEAVDDAAATLVVRGDSAATVALALESLEMIRPQSTLPFHASAEPAISPSAPANERAQPSSSDTIALSPEQTRPLAPAVALPWGTLVVMPEAVEAPRPAALPFMAPSVGAAPAIAAPAAPQERVATDTFAIMPEEEERFSEKSALPFATANKAPPPPALVSTPKGPPEASPEEEVIEATPILESPAAAAPEPSSAAPPAPAPPNEAVPPPSPWAPPPAPAALPPPPAAPRARPAPPTPSPALKQGLYGRFDRKG